MKEKDLYFRFNCKIWKYRMIYVLDISNTFEFFDLVSIHSLKSPCLRLNHTTTLLYMWFLWHMRAGEKYLYSKKQLPISSVWYKYTFCVILLVPVCELWALRPLTLTLCRVDHLCCMTWHFHFNSDFNEMQNRGKLFFSLLSGCIVMNTMHYYSINEFNLFMRLSIWWSSI